jgi:hypothetical protein
MSTTLFAIVTTENGVLVDVTSVELCSEDASYGIRRKDTGEIVIPAGVMLDNPSIGLYSFEVDDDDHDFFYEAAIKVTRTGDKISYITFLRYVPEPPTGSLSESSSESISTSEPSERTIHLDRGALEKVTLDGKDLFKLRITARDANLMPVDIFSYQRRPVEPRDPDKVAEEFMFVATPYDATVYPVDDPDPNQWPSFFRRDYLELYVPSSEIAQTIWNQVNLEVKALVEAYNRLDFLESVEETFIDGSGEFTTIVPDNTPRCDYFEFAGGQQEDMLTAELAAIDQS